MTKRFKAIGENIWQGNEIWCVAGGKHCADVIATALNEQHETIQRLEEQLKNSHMNEICEVCKHGKYSVDWYGEGEFECLKRHFGVDDWKCDGLKECDDFELDDKVYLND